VKVTIKRAFLKGLGGNLKPCGVADLRFLGARKGVPEIS